MTYFSEAFTAACNRTAEEEQFRAIQQQLNRAVQQFPEFCGDVDLAIDFFGAIPEDRWPDVWFANNSIH